MRALRVISAVAGVALAAGMGLGVPAAATAATAAPAAVAHAAAAASAVRGAGVTPDVNSFIEFPGSGETGKPFPLECVKGQDYSITLATVKSVSNNCEFRVFLVYADGGPARTASAQGGPAMSPTRRSSTRSG